MNDGGEGGVSAAAEGWTLADGVRWLDAAFQGPLPRRAQEALHRAGSLKASPEQLLEGDWFNQAPAALRSALGAFVGAPSDEVVLGNSTSWGLHVLAWSYPWSPGDEVLTVAGDFPANALPWSVLADRGVEVREIRPEVGALPRAEEIEAAVTARTRFFCGS